MKFHSRFNIDKYPISNNKITKILFTNVIDIHSTNHLYLINFTYLATLRIHLEERIARHEDRLKSKKKKMRMKKIFRGSESTYFRMTSNGTFQKGRLLAWRGEKWEVGCRAKKKGGRESKQERGKKRKQVGR